MKLLQWIGASIILNLMLVMVAGVATMDPAVLTDNSQDELVANLMTAGLVGSPNIDEDPRSDILSGDEDNLVFNPFDAAVNVVKWIGKVLALAVAIVLPITFLAGPLMQGSALQVAIGGLLILLLQMNNVFLIIRYIQYRRLGDN